MVPLVGSHSCTPLASPSELRSGEDKLVPLLAGSPITCRIATRGLQKGITPPPCDLRRGELATHPAHCCVLRHRVDEGESSVSHRHRLSSLLPFRTASPHHQPYLLFKCFTTARTGNNQQFPNPQFSKSPSIPIPQFPKSPKRLSHYNVHMVQPFTLRQATYEAFFFDRSKENRSGLEPN